MGGVGALYLALTCFKRTRWGMQVRRRNTYLVFLDMHQNVDTDGGSGKGKTEISFLSEIKFVSR